MAKTIIEHLESEHRSVEQKFAEFEQAADDPAKRQRLARLIGDELEVHTQVEEELVYPAVRQALDDGPDAVAHAEQEHAEAKAALARLQAAAETPTDPEFLTAFAELKSGVEEHVREEETDVFPRFRQAVDGARLEQLAEEVKALEKELQGGGRAVFHVTKYKNGWQVRQTGASAQLVVVDTKDSALDKARELAGSMAFSQVVVHNADGRIAEEFTYGDDPRNVTG
jgi:iron-sulfur cluster repair protein YtfE (RIC family)